MFNLYVTIHDKNPEVIILDIDVFFVRFNLQSNCKFYRPLIVFVKCDWLLENNSHHRQGVSLNLGYELNVPHKTHNR